MKKIPVQMLVDVVRALGPLAEELVFVGGASVSLYFQDAPMEEPRFTEDVDCVTPMITLAEHHRFEERLRQAGFQPCQDKGAPLCRWIVAGQRVDFMAQAPEALGFGNRWYEAGRKNAESVELPGGVRIKIFSLPYFLASKLEAHFGRGGDDLRLSQDLEDVLVVLGSRTHLNEVAERLDLPLRDYFRERFKRLLAHPGFEEAVSSALEFRQAAPLRKKRVLDFMNRLAAA